MFHEWESKRVNERVGDVFDLKKKNPEEAFAKN